MKEIELVEKDGLYSLTDIWKQSGLGKEKSPSNWTRTRIAKEFISHINRVANMRTAIKTVNGDGGGTFAHWQVALAYAKYLSPELHAKVNQIFKERVEEDKNPELGIERSHQRAVDNYKKQGKDEKWVQSRLSGINTRKGFTDTLSGHDCDGKGIGWSTNEIYRPVIGGSAKNIRDSRGIPRKANLRDTLTRTELSAIQLAESLVIDKVEDDSLSGNYECAMASREAGKEVKKAVDNVVRKQLK